ncbi:MULTISPECIES: hypothetical protein, partial [unclassified Phyllobacterium]|uniref:hypothetical protein n=1 Tax=unclassified Phyllobacterium TaxID=2638441 RepID=UPI003012CB08
LQRRASMTARLSHHLNSQTQKRAWQGKSTEKISMGKRKKYSEDDLVPFCSFIPNPLPELPFTLQPRHPQQTDEQYAADIEGQKRAHRRYVVMLSLFQAMATALGYHKICNKPACRRKQCCIGRRDFFPKDDYPVVLFPLCGTVEMAERARAAVPKMLAILKSGYNPLVAPDGTLHPGEKMLEVEP